MIEMTKRQIPKEIEEVGFDFEWDEREADLIFAGICIDTY